jgi:hypothetical protein
MSFGQDFLKGFIGDNGLRDYTHASKTFRTNGYELAPRLKFLFHTYFNLNPQIPGVQQMLGNGDVTSIGLSVKTVDLPSYQISVDTLNQYNRKRLVQSKIKYQPIQITFNDDGGDLIRNLWYNYFNYYYKDPVNKYEGVANTNGNSGDLQTTPAGFSYNTSDTYSNRAGDVNDWGYAGEAYSDGTFTGGGKPAFFKDIKIYGLNQHKFAAYVLINPMITDWRHDTYDYSQGSGTMTHTVTVDYETVKYYSGAIGASRPDTNVVGFADPNRYDQIRSSLARPGSQATVLGQGGLLDAGVGIMEDIQALTSGRGSLANVLGGVQKALNVNATLKRNSIGDLVRNDANSVKQDILRNSLPGAVRAAANSANSQIFPKAPK